MSFDKQDVVLATLGSGAAEHFSPVQLQKALFLIDRNAGPQLGGPFFHFVPYDYGPFDVGVYQAYDALKRIQLCEDPGTGRDRRYRLSHEGRIRAREVLHSMAPELRDYFGRVATFVQSLSFAALVSSIYKQFPEMKVNSVFRAP